MITAPILDNKVQVAAKVYQQIPSSNRSIRRVRTGKRHHSIFRNPQLLGIGSHALAAMPKDLVAFSESFYILSDCFNFSGKLTLQDVPPIFSRYGWLIPNCQSIKSGTPVLET
jgi:hypothetical protein